MIGTGSHRIGLACASLASGPIYLAACAVGSLVDRIPQPIVIAPADVIAFFVGLLPAMLGGFFVTVIPLAFAILVLSALASVSQALRPPAVWTAVGAAAGVLIVGTADEAQFGWSLAVICTAAGSLRLARAFLSWPPPEPLLRSPGGLVRPDV
jgi:hypothetical protein